VSAPSVTDTALSIGNRIGRYFSLVSMLPALLLVLWAYILVASRAWSAPPSLMQTAHRLSHWSASAAGWTLIATLIVALFLHPLQFVTTQFLEGYWGTSAHARAAMTRRILHHRRRRARLDALEQSHQSSWQDAADELLLVRFEDDQRQDSHASVEAHPDSWDEPTRQLRRTELLDSSAGDGLVADVVTEDAARRSWARYPEGGRVMPTRLGNALRRFEDAAGSQYGLDAVSTAPHFSLVAPDRHVQYLRDSRQQMDTTIRLCTVSLLATALAVGFLLRDGLWLLAALLPYSLAYVAYRGAVASADEYGTAVTTVVDLDRFLLYQELHVNVPRDTAEERKSNAGLVRLLGGDYGANVRYRRDQEGAGKRRLAP